MTIAETMLRQQMESMKSGVHNFCSLAGNALERITIYIDEDDPDAAKQEIADLREMLGNIT